jgi:hypothetical protein
MKKIKYLLSAIPAAMFATSANADISVSGSANAAYTDAGGNTSSTYGGGVSFAMSTTTDGGVTISGSSAISNDSDSVGSSSGATVLQTYHSVLQTVLSQLVETLV